MRKLIFPLIIIAALSINASKIDVYVDYGIPAGMWIYELNNGNGFDVLYMTDTGYGTVGAGAGIKAFRTNDPAYNVNMLSIPLTYGFDFLRNGSFSAGIYAYAGMTVIERSYIDVFERGICEHAGIKLKAGYDFEKFSVSGSAGMTRFSIINGGNYLYCSIGVGFPVFRMHTD